MGAIGRAAVGGTLIVGAGLGGILWLYLMDTAKPLYQDLGGSTFQSQWDLLLWAFPLAMIIIMFSAGLYIFYGGVQEERVAEVRRRR